jgi:hypothetical protein
VTIAMAAPASLDCIICGKPLPATGVDKAALMFDERGQPRGWGHSHHAIDLPREIRREITSVTCARCTLPLVGDHGIGDGRVWCRDGGDFLLAKEPDDVVTLIIRLHPNQLAAFIASEQRKAS